MEVLDDSEYSKRVGTVHGVVQHYPEVMGSISKRERSLLKKFYLEALFEERPASHRIKQLARDPRIADDADRAYQHLIEAVGLPANPENARF